MKKFIQVAIIASTGLMFIQTSANAQEWKHCFENVFDRFQQCKSRRGGDRCHTTAEKGFFICSNHAEAQNTGRFQETLPTYEQFIRWLNERYGGQTNRHDVR